MAAGQPIDHELVYDAAGNLVRVDVVGDLNCDGEVTFDDLDAFMLALTDPSGYAQAHPDCSLLLGDVDGDGDMDFDDIDYWVALVGVSAVAADRYEYDQENRLTAVRGPDGVLKLRIWYDALGRRILSETYDASGDPVKTTRDIYDGLAAIVEYEDENGAPVTWNLAREFIWSGEAGVSAGQSGGAGVPVGQLGGAGVSAGHRFPEPLVLIDHTAAGDAPAGVPENLYYVHDALGSVVGLTNDPAALAALDPNYPGGGGSAGVGGTTGILPALVERYDYDPYGATYIAYRVPSTYDDASQTRDPHLLTDSAAWQPCESSRFGNPLLWTAQRYDPAVRLYHFLFRTYSPTLGRWVQRDPAGYVDGASLYEYCRASPMVLTDPLGLAPHMLDGPTGPEPEPRLPPRELPPPAQDLEPGQDQPEVAPGTKGAVRKRNNPSATTNGCSFPITGWAGPGGAFRDACNQHDRCYATLGKTKARCDEEFLGDMLVACQARFGHPSLRHDLQRCITWANRFFRAVRLFGHDAYQEAQHGARLDKIAEQSRRKREAEEERKHREFEEYVRETCRDGVIEWR
ncbi:MAG: hypothetical protein IPM13_09080 [Phycisphaerales bacterium]|nr:hypothetical protein [Phycisphaerales bacterium]